LRFYEQKGLLAPARRGWTRLFSYRDRARLQLILRGKKVGFSLEEIKEMLDLYNLKDGQLTQLRVASTKFRERLEALRKQRVELEEAITDLEKTAVLVDNMLKEREAGNMPKRVANAWRIGGASGSCRRSPREVEVPVLDVPKPSWFGEDIELLSEIARRFFERECVPHYEEWEKHGSVGSEIWRKAGAAGLLGPSVPE